MDKRNEIIAEARRWLGASWHHQACVPYIAADCGQILIDIYVKCELIERPVEVEYYPRDWALHNDEERYLNMVERYAHQVISPLPGDLAVWKVGRTFSHGAIVVDWPSIIHAHIQNGVILDDALQNELAGRAVRFYSVFRD
jgi:hypothetical protein